MKTYSILLVLSACAILPSGSGHAKSWTCSDKSIPGLEANTQIMTNAPLFLQEIVHKKPDGSTERRDLTRYVNTDSVCGIPIDFKNQCKTGERTRAGQYEFSFQCGEAVSGEIYIEESGSGELKCDLPGGKVERVLFAECAVSQDLDTRDADALPAEKLGLFNAVEHNGTRKKLVYKDFEFSSETKDSLVIHRYLFNDVEICGNRGGVTFDLMSRSSFGGLSLESRLTPVFDTDNPIFVEKNKSYVLRVWIYGYTCNYPSMYFELK